MVIHTYPHKPPEEDLTDHLKSPVWQPILRVVWCLIWWLVQAKRRVCSYVTLNGLTETRCHKGTQNNSPGNYRIIWFQEQLRGVLGPICMECPAHFVFLRASLIAAIWSILLITRPLSFLLYTISCHFMTVTLCFLVTAWPDRVHTWSIPNDTTDAVWLLPREQSSWRRAQVLSLPWNWSARLPRYRRSNYQTPATQGSDVGRLPTHTRANLRIF